MASVFVDRYEFQNIEAVLFDKDGTFADTNLYWGKIAEKRIEAIIAEFNLDENIFNELCKIMGYNPNSNTLICNGPLAILSRNEVIEIVFEYLKQYVDTDFETLNIIFNKVHQEFLNEGYKYVKIIKGAVECFERLKAKGIKLAVVTSDSYLNTINTLKYFGLDSYFDVVTGKEISKEPKKTGVPAILTLEQMNINKSNAIVVGDAPMDALMAKNADMAGCIIVENPDTCDFNFEDVVVCNSLNAIN